MSKYFFADIKKGELALLGRARYTDEELVYKKISAGLIAECLQNAWSRETSNDPEGWTPENPAWGQCAVTALLVQSFLGGEIIRLDLAAAHDTHLRASRSHYWNRTSDGTDIDLTVSQFKEIAAYDEYRKYGIKTSRAREELLANPNTWRRYEILYRAFIREFGGEFEKE